MGGDGRRDEARRQRQGETREDGRYEERRGEVGAMGGRGEL